jgi:hypothetical protein
LFIADTYTRRWRVRYEKGTFEVSYCHWDCGDMVTLRLFKGYGVRIRCIKVKHFAHTKWCYHLEGRCVKMSDENVQISIVVPLDIQNIVEELIEAHAKLKALEQQVKKLREIIEPFMKTNNLEELIAKTQVGKIILGMQDRPHITAQYTYYNHKCSKSYHPRHVRSVW